MPDLHGDGPRGLFCPDCGVALNSRLIAKSYPSPAGQYRLRYCGTLDCQGLAEGVETVETVAGFEPRVLDVSDLGKEDVRALREMVRQMRKLAGLREQVEAVEREHAGRAMALPEATS